MIGDPGAVRARLPVVLLADANADTREMYAEVLDPVVERIVHADDGRDALVKVLTNPPGVLVTNTDLPFIDGYELCRLVRSDLHTQFIPIVLITARNAVADIQRARRTGANVVLVQPCAPALLRDAIVRLQDGPEEAERGRNVSSPFAAPAAVNDRDLVRHAEPLKHKSREHERFVTTTPPIAPLMVSCPTCDRPLTYRQSYVGGVSARHAEQWDSFTCSGCGAEYQYRHRTRKLRAQVAPPDLWSK